MALVCVFAIWASIVDARRRLLPNALLASMALSAALVVAARFAGGVWLRDLPWVAALDPRLDPPWMCVLVALLVLALLAGLEMGRRRKGAEPGLGFGDAKLAFCWMLALGLLGLWGFALGCGSGALAAKVRHERTFALGPWVSAWCVALAVLAALPWR